MSFDQNCFWVMMIFQPFPFVIHRQVYYQNANVKQIDVPSFSGSFGILPNHVPLLAVLKPGIVTVHEQDGAPKKYFGI